MNKNFWGTMPPRLPTPLAHVIGAVVLIPAEMSAYQSDDVVLRVTRVRDDISLWYDGWWVWIEGDELDACGAVVRPAFALVHVSAFAADRLR